MIASAWVSVHLGSIASGWQVVLQIGAGTGAVYILRWYWWRINAWSEISAMGCSLLATVALNHWKPFAGNESVVFAKGALTTTIITTAVWLLVTFLTKPEPDEVLLAFYRRVRPDVRGWKRIAEGAPEITQHRDLERNLGAWVLGCVMVYCCLFGTGKLLLHETGLGAGLIGVSVISALMLYRTVIRNFRAEPDAPSATT